MDLLCSWLATGKLKYITLCFFYMIEQLFQCCDVSICCYSMKIRFGQGLDKKQQIPSYRARLLTYAENVAKGCDSLANTVDILVEKMDMFGSCFFWNCFVNQSNVWISKLSSWKQNCWGPQAVH